MLKKFSISRVTYFVLALASQNIATINNVVSKDTLFTINAYTQCTLNSPTTELLRGKALSGLSHCLGTRIFEGQTVELYTIQPHAQAQLFMVIGNKIFIHENLYNFCLSEEQKEALITYASLQASLFGQNWGTALGITGLQVACCAALGALAEKTIPYAYTNQEQWKPFLARLAIEFLRIGFSTTIFHMGYNNYRAETVCKKYAEAGYSIQDLIKALETANCFGKNTSHEYEIKFLKGLLVTE